MCQVKASEDPETRSYVFCHSSLTVPIDLFLPENNYHRFETMPSFIGIPIIGITASLERLFSPTNVLFEVVSKNAGFRNKVQLYDHY